MIINFIKKHMKEYRQYLYVKKCYNRGNAHLGWIKVTIAKIPEFFLGLGIVVYERIKGFLSQIPIWLYIVMGLTYIIGELALTLIVGHIDLKHRLTDEDVSLDNKYNPEIQQLLQRGK